MGKRRHKKNKQQTSQVNNYAGYTGGYAGYGYNACDHNYDPIDVGQDIVLVTAYSWTNKDETIRPDLFVGLCDFWVGKTSNLFAAGIPEPTPKVAIPTIIVDWTDQKECPEEVLPWLVDLILARIHKGQIVNMGCMGAHGRTGTLLACLIGKAEGLPPLEAIRVTRARHCTKAVESMAQIKQVYRFLGSTDEVAEKHWKVTQKPFNWVDWIQRHPQHTNLPTSTNNYGYGYGNVP